MIEIIKCSKIVVKNSAWVVTKWTLDACSNELYKTTGAGTAINQKVTFDLKALGIQEGIQFTLIAKVVAGFQAMSNVILTYSPDSDVTVNLKLTGTTLFNDLKKVDKF